jgi:hypothetical protein
VIEELEARVAESEAAVEKCVAECERARQLLTQSITAEWPDWVRSTAKREVESNHTRVAVLSPEQLQEVRTQVDALADSALTIVPEYMSRVDWPHLNPNRQPYYYTANRAISPALDELRGELGTLLVRATIASTSKYNEMGFTWRRDGETRKIVPTSAAPSFGRNVDEARSQYEEALHLLGDALREADQAKTELSKARARAAWGD